MSDLRKNERHTCTVPVEGKEGSVFDRTAAVDFSEGGLGFVSRHRIPVNKEIPIEIDLTSEENPVFVVGRVKWVRRILNSKKYRIGIVFKKLLKGSKSRLMDYFSRSRMKS